MDFVSTQTLIISISKAQFFTITILTFSILVASFTIFILVRFGRPKKGFSIKRMVSFYFLSPFKKHCPHNKQKGDSGPAGSRG